MNNFEEMSLASELSQALTELKFTQPTETQVATIPLLLDRKDIMVCAATGSGKTASFAIPMFQFLLTHPGKTGLVLAPTRELAHQISEFIRELTQFASHFRVTSIVGGADIRKQLTALKKKPQIIVATPGRLIDHLKRKSIDIKNCETLVLDEGDRMLDMGFAPQLDQILKYLPKKRQTSLFTATMPARVKTLASKYLYKPETITVGRRSMPVKSVKQSIVQLDDKQKPERIIDELNRRTGSVIIFLRTKRRTDSLFKSLKSYGFDVAMVHGGRSQGQRNRALINFRSGKCRILCATDVAARGIDVPQVEHVINYDLPMMDEDYVHRIGRTARNGATGEAISFVGNGDHRAWLAISKKYQISGVELKNVNLTAAKKKTSNKKKKYAKKKTFKSSNSQKESQFKKKRRNIKKKGSSKKRSSGKKASSSKSNW